MLSCCCLACWLGGLPYLEQPLVHLAFALPSGYLLSRAVRKFVRKRRLAFYRVQFRWLLEHLLARLSAGNTLERAFMEAPAVLGKLLGTKSALLIGLQILEQQLAAHLPLDQQLNRLSSHFPCPEAQVCFQVLPGLRRSGGQISQYIRRQLHMVSEQLSLQQDLNAANSQRQTEAVILTLLPFILTGLMFASKSFSPQDSANQPIMTFGLMAAYVLAVLAGVLALTFLADSGSTRSRQPAWPGKTKSQAKFLERPAKRLLAFYKNVLPGTYGSRVLSVLQDQWRQSPLDSQACIMYYFQKKILYMLAAVCPAFLLLLAEPSLWFCLPAVPLLMGLLQDQQILSLARWRETEYRLDYPLFLNLIEALLQTGLSLHLALNICVDTLIPHQLQKPIVGPGLLQDLTEIRNQFQVGLPADLIMEKLSASCKIPEAQAAMLLMIRYDRNGGAELLNLLQLQASACWNLHHSTTKKQLEQHSLLLILPMMLDLLSVMLTALLPALASLAMI